MYMIVITNANCVPHVWAKISLYGRYHDLINHYEISVSRLISDLSLNQ